MLVTKRSFIVVFVLLLMSTLACNFSSLPSMIEPTPTRRANIPVYTFTYRFANAYRDGVEMAKALTIDESVFSRPGAGVAVWFDFINYDVSYVFYPQNFSLTTIPGGTPQPGQQIVLTRTLGSGFDTPSDGLRGSLVFHPHMTGYFAVLFVVPCGSGPMDLIYALGEMTVYQSKIVDVSC